VRINWTAVAVSGLLLGFSLVLLRTLRVREARLGAALRTAALAEAKAQRAREDADGTSLVTGRLMAHLPYPGTVIIDGKRHDVAGIRMAGGKLVIDCAIRGPVTGGRYVATFFGRDGQGVFQLDDMAVDDVAEGDVSIHTMLITMAGLAPVTPRT
jgi:hypothetical protein